MGRAVHHNIGGDVDDDRFSVKLRVVFRAFPLRRLQLDAAAEAQDEAHREAEDKQYQAQHHQHLHACRKFLRPYHMCCRVLPTDYTADVIKTDCVVTSDMPCFDLLHSPQMCRDFIIKAG